MIKFLCYKTAEPLIAGDKKSFLKKIKGKKFKMGTKLQIKIIKWDKEYEDGHTKTIDILYGFTNLNLVIEEHLKDLGEV